MYGVFVSVVGESLDGILNVMSINMSNLSQMLSSNIQGRNIHSSCMFGITYSLANVNMSVYYEAV